MGRSTLLVLAGSAAVLIGLTGCTPAVTPRANTAAAPPAISRLVVSPSGLGDLRVGSPVGRSDLVSYGEHACSSNGGWLPRYPRASDTSGGQQLNPFDVNTTKGTRTGLITAVFVWSRSIRTAEGIAVGSSEAAVKAAYPDATVTASTASDLYVVNGSRGELVIEIAGHNEYAQGEWPPDVLGTVVWMDVLPKNAAPRSLAGSNDAGPCPVKGHVPEMDDDGD